MADQNRMAGEGEVAMRDGEPDPRAVCGRPAHCAAPRGVAGGVTAPSAGIAFVSLASLALAARRDATGYVAAVASETAAPSRLALCRRGACRPATSVIAAEICGMVMKMPGLASRRRLNGSGTPMNKLDVWDAKYGQPRPRRLLALDGGGILGVMTLEILAVMERQLAETTGAGKTFRLGDYFDYVGGTSTGAIIAAGLAVGMTAGQLLDFYVETGPLMFEKRFFLQRIRSFYAADPLRGKLQEVLGARTLGASDLRCLLLVVTRNATTDSPWPVTNNPFARYNEAGRADCNLQIPLWQLVRASTAAPVYFPPEVLQWDPTDPAKTFVFVDGGVTPYNNPALLLYRKATLPQYRLGWPTGEDKLTMVSIGTGSAARLDQDLDARGRLIPADVARLPGVLMGGANVDQDINCRAVGRCVFGAPIDRELGDMRPRHGDPLTGEPVPLREDCGRAFLYARYDPDVTRVGLNALGLQDIDPDEVQAMDSVKHIAAMRRVGRAYADRFVDMSVFGDPAAGQ
ncbi:patatin-like phospholipase family protein [Falsiroseomonas sp. HC035]|uniref:patatin-like phospholipase family protein n=1 Tax=Falsiroseomonas sp. HC035 TaxID=3390999 RepID=UPI003D31E357